MKRSTPLHHGLRAAAATSMLAWSAGVIAQACVPPPAGALYWLAADGDYDDRAGFFNAAMEGSVDFVPGKVGKAVRFDADTDRLPTTAVDADMNAVKNNFTYMLWARPTATTSDCAESANGNCSGVQQRFALYPQHGVGSNSAGIGLVIGTNAICVSAHAGFHLPCLLRYETTISAWTHIAVVVEGKQPRLYVDGTLVRVGLASERDVVFASWGLVGNADNLGAYRGDLDEVAVYGRALADAEIQADFSAGAAGRCRAACVSQLTADPWQHAQVLSTTGLLSSDASDMFGGSGSTPEPGNTVFADGRPDGTTHTVEWQTSTPIPLGGFRLNAYHEPGGTPARAFRRLRLQARTIGGAYTTVYDSPVGVPYTDEGPVLDRCVSMRPRVAQQFRAEFTQHGGTLFGGVRIGELDAVLPDRIFRHDFD